MQFGRPDSSGAKIENKQRKLVPSASRPLRDGPIK